MIPVTDKPATERHERGKIHFFAAFNHFLGHSGLSHDQTASVVAWGLGQAGVLSASDVSKIRNGKFDRGAGLPKIDAIAAANTAIWLWSARSPAKAREQLGPPSSWRVEEAWLDDAGWMPHPDNPAEPLRFGNWCEVLAGHLVLPYLLPRELPPRESSDRLVRLLSDAALASGASIRDAIDTIMQAYGPADQGRRSRLKGVLTDSREAFSRDELELELHDLAEVLRVLQGKPEGSYGAAELQAELRAESPTHPD